jgi:opacity protein-like surface antigen
MSRTRPGEPAPVEAFSVENKHWRWGGMLGAGVEFAFTNSISGKLEYNYMDFGTRTYTFTIAPADVSFSEPLTPKSGRTSTWSKSA